MNPGAADWSHRYLKGATPWDMGRTHPELERRLDIDPSLGGIAPGRALVPGCGRGHDALALAEAGWEVTAIDAAQVLEADLRARLEPIGAMFVCTDIFSWSSEEPYDVIFDHTFFCAIPPEDRPKMGDVCNRLLGPSGRVISIVFPVGRPEREGGPPFGYDTPDMTTVLTGFRLVEESEPFMVGRRAWPHRWAVWERD